MLRQQTQEEAIETIKASFGNVNIWQDILDLFDSVEPPTGWLQGRSLLTQKDPDGDEMDVMMRRILTMRGRIPMMMRWMLMSRMKT
jgi:hypothetical protein